MHTEVKLGVPKQKPPIKGSYNGHTWPGPTTPDQLLFTGAAQEECGLGSNAVVNPEGAAATSCQPTAFLPTEE